MKSRRNDKFRKKFSTLPELVKLQARKAYRQFKTNPSYPSLEFKLIHTGKAIYSVRIGLYYRALGVLRDDVIVWFWIGSHAEYNALIDRL